MIAILSAWKDDLSELCSVGNGHKLLLSSAPCHITGRETSIIQGWRFPTSTAADVMCREGNEGIVAGVSENGPMSKPCLHFTMEANVIATTTFFTSSNND